MAASTENWSVSFFHLQDLRSFYMNELLNGIIKPGIYNQNISIIVRDNSMYLKIEKGTIFIFSNNYMKNNNKWYRNLDEMGTYVVKCVCSKSYEYKLCEENEFNTLLDGSSPKKEFLITAFLQFNPSESSDSSSISAPSFYISIPTEQDEENNIHEYLFKRLVGTSSSAYTVIEGIKDSADDNFFDTGHLESNQYIISYLNVGFVISKSQSGGISNAKDNFSNEYVFTGRGLPEYNRNMYSYSKYKNISIFSCKDLRNIYLSIPEVYIDNVLYNDSSRKEWYDIYKSTDNFYTDSFCKKIKDYTGTEFTKEFVYLVDFFYLHDSTEYANISDTNILDSNSTLKLDVFSFTEEYDSKKYTQFGSVQEQGILLDVSKSNTDIKNGFIFNKSILPRVIDRIRQTKNNAIALNTIIPVCMVVRPLTKEKSEYIGVDSISSRTQYNPNNIISFLDLSNGSNNLQNISMKRNAYTVLSVID